MTDNTQPKALRLADRLQAAVQTYPQMSEDEPGGYASEVDQIMDDAAAELRRQHVLLDEQQLTIAALNSCIGYETTTENLTAVGRLEARIADLEAQLASIVAGGVQALSAAPAVPNGDELRRIARSARTSASDDASPTEYVLAGWKAAMLAASPTPPAEQQATKETSGGFHVWRDISTAPKDGSRFVATGHNYGLYSEVRHTCVAQWFRGCWMEASDWNETSELKYLTHWMPLPSPPDDVAAPAEQPATTEAATPKGAATTGAPLGGVYAELPEPTASIGIDDAWHEPAMRDFADRTHALRMEQAAPKAAPQQEAQEPVAWQGVHDQTDLYYTKPEQADVRPLYTTPQPEPAPLSRDQIREVFMAHGFTIKEGQTDLKQYVYDAAYALLELVAAPQQEAQEPVAWLYTTPMQDGSDFVGASSERLQIGVGTPPGTIEQPLYLEAPQPAPAPLSDDVVQKTWALIDELEKLRGADRYDEDWVTLNKRDSELRAAIAAQGGTP